jgi:iron(III) transport system ATP-binding protein
MSSLKVKCTSLVKIFDSTTAVNRFSLELTKGQVLSLVGPSGCGKTTVLRLIAGLENPDTGTVEIAGKNMNGQHFFLPPEIRHVGMMFQDYALFPHMDVLKNIAYGLGRDSGRKDRLTEVMKLTGIEHLKTRMPYQLSGGEQQRVALARAIAPRPDVLLLDEPFSNLDEVLRSQIRQETKDILKKSNITTVFVTHSTEEAMEMGQTVAVMNQGVLEQVGSPETIFNSPVNEFVANFMGMANFLEATLSKKLLHTELGSLPAPRDLPNDTTLRVMIRPETLSIEPSDTGQGIIQQRIFRGAFCLFKLELVSGKTIHCLGPSTKKHSEGSRVAIKFKHGYVPWCFVRGRAHTQAES